MRQQQLVAWWALLALFSGATVLMLWRWSAARSERRRQPMPENGIRTSTTTAPQEPPFVKFESTAGLDAYPWHHIYFGHWRRRVLAPGDAHVDRAIQAGPEAAELQLVLERAARELRARTGDAGFRPADCVGGRFRLAPGAGVQYEMYFRTHAGGAPAEPAAAAEFHTVRLQRAFEPLRAEYVGSGDGAPVHVLLPYYNRLAALEAFVTRFRRLVAEGEELTLTVVRFSEGLPTMEDHEERQDQAGVVRVVNEANRAVGGGRRRVRLVERAGAFSAGAGWMAAADDWRSAEDVVLFLCDVDMLFGREFLQRCRANAEPGAMVYYPQVFSAYNPDIAYGVIKKRVIPVLKNYEKKQLINQDLGYWLDAEYTASCQHLSDFRRLSEPFANQASPNFDVRLYERFVKSLPHVIRMPDRDLVRVYRRVTCLREMGREEYNSCLKKKAMNEASKLEWGLWVYKNMGDTDDVEKFLQIVHSYQSSDVV